MDRNRILKTKKRAEKILFIAFFALICILLLVNGFQAFRASETPENFFQNELLKTKCHRIDDNCFFFEAMDKELVTLLKAFKEKYPKTQIKEIIPSGNGTFVLVSLKEQKN